MGKQRVNILVLCTAVFVSFILGFLLGRNYNHAPVQISNVSITADSAPAETTGSAVLQAATAEFPTVMETQVPAEIPVTDAHSVETTEESTSETHSAQAPEAAQTVPENADSQETVKAEASPSSSGLININTASAAQLQTLPGIGEVLSQRIVEYRTANGPFPSVYALTNVKGIGEKRLAAILDLITV